MRLPCPNEECDESFVNEASMWNHIVAEHAPGDYDPIDAEEVDAEDIIAELEEP